MIGTLSEGHYDGADWLLLLAVIAFALGLVLALSTRVARPSWLNATTMQLAGLTLLALAVFVV